MKYYFITYIGERRDGDKDSVWNEIIEDSPMKFIKKMNDSKDTYYCNFILTFALRITKAEYLKWKGGF